MPSVTELDERTICDVIAAVQGLTPSRGYIRTYAAGRITYDVRAREAYSYGRHFPLFRYVPRNGRHGPLWVINGDVWRNGSGPSRTDAHQGAARRAIERTGIPSIILPFSALDGAGIDIDSIRPLDVRADSWETVTVERHRLDDVPRWRRTHTVRLAGPVPQWGYDPNLSVEIPIEPDPDGVYRWTEDRHRLGDALFTAVRDGRRSRYLSSFDYHENPPLYFLCEVPRSGFPTVDGALDSLAPRAVHAAMLAGKDVQRQGDVFFIGTSHTTETLADRGAVFGRLTQWTRGAAARPGEVTFRAPDKAKVKRTRARETAYRRRIWRETFRQAVADATVRHVPDPERRERNRALWADLRERHSRELAEVTAAGADPTAPESSPCPVCHAGIGAPCLTLPDTDDIPSYLRGKACSGSGRYDVTYRHSRETDELRRETRAPDRGSCGPVSRDGARRRWAKIRADRETRILHANRELRRAILSGGMPRGYSIGGGRGWREGIREHRRRCHKTAVRQCRENLQRAMAPATDGTYYSRRHARDFYRQRYGANAVALWDRATLHARTKYRPETVDGTDVTRRNRERIRRHLMIYGTSHSATDVARIGTAVYVRGTVRHAVDLEPNRREGPDHRPLTLAPDTWYLAVRNTVPRQNRRRRRRVAT